MVTRRIRHVWWPRRFLEVLHEAISKGRQHSLIEQPRGLDAVGDAGVDLNVQTCSTHDGRGWPRHSSWPHQTFASFKFVPSRTSGDLHVHAIPSPVSFFDPCNPRVSSAFLFRSLLFRSSLFRAPLPLSVPSLSLGPISLSRSHLSRSRAHPFRYYYCMSLLPLSPSIPLSLISAILFYFRIVMNPFHNHLHPSYRSPISLSLSSNVHTCCCHPLWYLILLAFKAPASPNPLLVGTLVLGLDSFLAFYLFGVVYTSLRVRLCCL